MPIYTSKTVKVVKLTDFFFPKSLDRMDTWTHVDKRSIWRITVLTFCPGTKFIPARCEMLWCLIHRIHSLHFYKQMYRLLNQCFILFYTCVALRTRNIPVTWCLDACMVAPCSSSDTNVAPLPVAVFTVSFSLWPTDSAASCWRSSLSSDGKDING